MFQCCDFIVGYEPKLKSSMGKGVNLQLYVVIALSYLRHDLMDESSDALEDGLVADGLGSNPDTLLGSSARRLGRHSANKIHTLSPQMQNGAETYAAGASGGKEKCMLRLKKHLAMNERRREAKKC